MPRQRSSHVDQAYREICGEVSFTARPVVSLLRPIGSIGRVHSVFPELVNVVTPQGRFVAIHGDAVGRTPMSLGVRNHGECAFVNASRTGFVIREEDDLFKTSGFLVLGDFRWVYDSRQTPVWEARLGLVDVSRGTAGRAIPVVRQAIRQAVGTGFQNGFGALAGASTRSGRLAGATIGAFVRAWSNVLSSSGFRTDQRQSDELICALTSLIGLGPGLTPSGDDFVIGWTASAHLLGKRGSDILARHRHSIEATCRERTHALSAQYISHALSGEWTEHVGLLLRACQRLGSASSGSIAEATADVVEAAQNVIAVGATSGMDMVLGFIKGLEVIDMVERLSQEGTSEGVR